MYTLGNGHPALSLKKILSGSSERARVHGVVALTDSPQVPDG